ncbi:hypothetical protein ASD12_29895 [Mesorhizobium sp. Root102]|nr:hypothetical protein ASD12_29895 [Mesorhizobium sp. Root102]
MVEELWEARKAIPKRPANSQSDFRLVSRVTVAVIPEIKGMPLGTLSMATRIGMRRTSPVLKGCMFERLLIACGDPATIDWGMIRGRGTRLEQPG